MDITAGAVVELFTAPRAVGADVPLVVQVLKVRPPDVGRAKEYRLVVSDGAHFMTCAVRSEVFNKALFEGGVPKMTSAVRFVRYDLHDDVDKSDASKTRRSVLVTAMENLGTQDRAGEPVDVTRDTTVKRSRSRAAKQGADASTATFKARASDSSAGGAGGGKAAGGGEVYSTIGSLNPYRVKWTIKARVTKRGDVKTWNNAKGEGSLFSVDLLDAEGTEIRATFWKDAVDLFYTMLAPGVVATFAGGKLKPANKQFTAIKNEYELTFDKTSTIKLAPADNTIKTVLFDFVKLAEVEAALKDTTVDVVGIVKDFSPASSLTAKATGRELWKRDLTLVDDSCVAVRLTLWGADAQRDDAEFAGHVVACVKGARVGEYHGKNLSSGFNSVVVLGVGDVPEAAALKAWWTAAGSSAPVKALSASGGGGAGGGPCARFEDRKSLSVIRDAGLGFGQSPDWVEASGHITFINTGGTFCYAACPEPDNRKKVTLQTDGTWLCEATGKTYDAPEYRYVLSFRVADSTGSTFVTAFNDEAVQIMGCTAGELKYLQDTDQVAFEAAFARALFKELVLTLRCKAEEYKDESRVRVSVHRAKAVDFVNEARAMVDVLKAGDA